MYYIKVLVSYQSFCFFWEQYTHFSPLLAGNLVRQPYQYTMILVKTMSKVWPPCKEDQLGPAPIYNDSSEDHVKSLAALQRRPIGSCTKTNKREIEGLLA